MSTSTSVPKKFIEISDVETGRMVVKAKAPQAISETQGVFFIPLRMSDPALILFEPVFLLRSVKITQLNQQFEKWRMNISVSRVEGEVFTQMEDYLESRTMRDQIQASSGVDMSGMVLRRNASQFWMKLGITTRGSSFTTKFFDLAGESLKITPYTIESAFCRGARVNLAFTAGAWVNGSGNYGLSYQVQSMQLVELAAPETPSAESELPPF